MEILFTKSGNLLRILMGVLKECFHSIKVIIADGGYCGEIIREVKNKFGYLLQIVLRKDSSEKFFQPVHKRWIIERTFA